MTDEAELAPAAGFVEPSLQAEFPGLRLDWCSIEGGLRDSPREVRRRLALMSNRLRGASVVTMRTQPIPHAYRSFFRHIGLDPDANRIPSEAAAVARLLHGQFRSRNLVDDALLIALVETGVPVWAIDADRVHAGGPGIRTTVVGDRFGVGGAGSELEPGRPVVADAEHIHALLFGEIVPDHAVRDRSARITLFAVGVAGVPAIHVEEALWLCMEILDTR